MCNFWGATAYIWMDTDRWLDGWMPSHTRGDVTSLCLTYIVAGYFWLAAVYVLADVVFIRGSGRQCETEPERNETFETMNAGSEERKSKGYRALWMGEIAPFVSS
mmetsp:Transcript_43958/g.124460  ORF Transcript_43958/g.124460 Transcript_43958/m.124460 type:complete len:105 (+) Transcript_43958:87-401(+)